MHKVDDWEKIGRQILKIELEKREMNYIQLQEALLSLGVNTSVANIRNKLARGNFNVSFFVQCLTAIGVESLRLKDYINNIASPEQESNNQNN